MSPVTGGRWVTIFDSYSGAWQQNVSLDRGTVLQTTSVYACIRQVANDIAKLPMDLIAPIAPGSEVWRPTDRVPQYSKLFRRPNPWQTWPEFVQWYVASLLIAGNTYVLKRYDNANRVSQFIVLDPTLVTPLISPSGDVFYRLAADFLNGLTIDNESQVTVPARYVIHQKYLTLNHPLYGCSPLQVAGMSATTNYKIGQYASRFFTNFARPAGVLEAPEEISDEQATRLRDRWAEYQTADNAGRIAVLEQGLTFKSMQVTSVDAQMIETLKWTAEDVCNAFGVPAWKIGAAGAAAPNSATAEAREQMYYSSTLQPIITTMEALIDDGLDLGSQLGVRFNLWHLLRLDTAARYKSYSDAIAGAWMAPNEARACEDLAPLPGGDALYMQQQNYSLEALAKRDSKPDPFEVAKPTVVPADGTPPADNAPAKALPQIQPYDALRTYAEGELCTHKGNVYQLRVNALMGVAPGTPDVHAWGRIIKAGKDGRDADVSATDAVVEDLAKKMDNLNDRVGFLEGPQ
jgi:HK97 family phage portal protein